jgi:hypothetical protein
MSETSSTKLSYKHVLTYQQLACCILHKTLLGTMTVPMAFCLHAQQSTFKQVHLYAAGCSAQTAVFGSTVIMQHCNDRSILSAVDRE